MEAVPAPGGKNVTEARLFRRSRKIYCVSPVNFEQR
jgi:hypothetical protein